MFKKLFFILLFLTQGIFAQAPADTFPLSGRVATAAGQGIYNARIVITSDDCGGWGGAAVSSSPFGYYAVNIPRACNSFAVTPTSKAYTFTPGGVVFLIVTGEPIENVNFTGSRN